MSSYHVYLFRPDAGWYIPSYWAPAADSSKRAVQFSVFQQLSNTPTILAHQCHHTGRVSKAVQRPCRSKEITHKI